jgi:hypothetical protein
MSILITRCKYCKGVLIDSEILFQSHYQCEKSLFYLNHDNFNNVLDYQCSFINKVLKTDKISFSWNLLPNINIFSELHIKFKNIINSDNNLQFINNVGIFLINNSIVDPYFMKNIDNKFENIKWLTIILFILRLEGIKFDKSIFNILLTNCIDRNNSASFYELLIRYEYMYPKMRKFLSTEYNINPVSPNLFKKNIEFNNSLKIQMNLVLSNFKNSDDSNYFKIQIFRLDENDFKDYFFLHLEFSFISF